MGVSQDPRTHPAFAAFDQILPLSGFSGAAIAIAKAHRGTQFVRKAAGSAELNDVLRQQAARLAWLGAQLDGAARVPEILDEGDAEGLYYFDMTFVRSRDANAYLSTVPFEDLDPFAARIEQLMERLSTSVLAETDRPRALELLGRKVMEIRGRLDPYHGDLLEPLEQAIARLDHFSDEAAATVTHGDLTFENILVSAGGDLWLIDPIQSPIDHYWFDWSKLFQECEGRWHLHRGKRVPLNVSRWLRHRWFATASKLAPDYPARHYLLLALTFARILPYARSQKDLDFVRERVNAFGKAALDHL